MINRADRFGLAQLHQLRGRVGRSHHRAYAYLVVPDRRAMTADAIKRLEAIESLGDLGVGFNLATHDLEIRGAGEILGDEQSGQIQEVGYSLYTRLLERAVAALRAGKAPELDRPLDTGAEIDVREPALIPEDYLVDVHTRLIMYKRIAGAPSEEALEELMVEMIDRFGLMPASARLLFDLARLKLRAAPLGVRKIDAGADRSAYRVPPRPGGRSRQCDSSRSERARTVPTRRRRAASILGRLSGRGEPGRRGAAAARLARCPRRGMSDSPR